MGEYQGVINLVGGAGIALLGWLGRTLYDEVRSIRRDHEQHKLYVAQTFATEDSLTRLSDRIEAKLDRIIAKLDQKADK